MQVFDLNDRHAFPYAERQKNVFFQADNFKVRLIELHAGGTMLPCEMTSYVLFYVIEGQATVFVNQQAQMLSAGQLLITEPAELSMQTEGGVKIFGVQIAGQAK